VAPYVRLAILLGLALAAAGAPARGQDRSTQERLDRLERDLNMLQRQVYRGVPPPPLVPGDPAAAVNAQLRLDHLENEVRELTGRVEEFANQVEQVRQRLERVSGDVETRFGEAAGPAGGPLAATGQALRPAPGSPPRRPVPLDRPGPVPASPDDEPPPFASAGRSGPLAAAPPAGAPPGGGPAPIYGTLTPPGTLPVGPRAVPTGPPPTDLAGAVPAMRPATGAALPAGSTMEQYNHALGLLKQANYSAAEAALKAFVEQHPKDPMAGNAQYFLGDIHFERREYAEAAADFAESYKRFPKGAKAADNLLKLGMSLARINRKQDACTAFARLDQDFPKPGASVKERAAAEKKRLGC
jgi:tol-pal system protein YbgF